MMPGGAAGMTIKFVACWGLSGGAFQWGANGGGGLGFLALRGCYRRDDAPGDSGDTNRTGKGERK